MPAVEYYVIYTHYDICAHNMLWHASGCIRVKKLEAQLKAMEQKLAEATREKDGMWKKCPVRGP